MDHACASCSHRFWPAGSQTCEAFVCFGERFTRRCEAENSSGASKTWNTRSRRGKTRNNPRKQIGSMAWARYCGSDGLTPNGKGYLLMLDRRQHRDLAPRHVQERNPRRLLANTSASPPDQLLNRAQPLTPATPAPYPDLFSFLCYRASLPERRIQSM